MRRLFPALMLLLFVVPQARAAATEDSAEPPVLVGVWRGELKQGEGSRARSLQLVLRIRQGKEGYAATLDGLGAGQRDLKAENLILVEDVLSFQIPQVDGRFAGNFYGDSLRGNWSLGDESWSLIFFRDQAFVAAPPPQ